jgi:hypothetical protein
MELDYHQPLNWDALFNHEYDHQIREQTKLATSAEFLNLLPRVP